MNKNNQVYLHDILTSINKIHDYIGNINFEQFNQDHKTQDAVIRQFQIMGEAANRITDQFIENHPDFPRSEAVKMRNRLIHGYNEVDMKTVWNTIQKDLPELEKQVKKLL